MKRLFLLFIISTTILYLASCKKGEDDPAISLRSRDSRFVGNWKITFIDMFGSENSGGVTTTSSLTLNGSTLNYTVTTSGVENITKLESFDMNLKVKKNNDFYIVQTYSLNGIGYSDSYSQKWNWQNSDKTLVYLPIKLSSIVECQQWHLRELRENKLTLISEYEYDLINGDDVDKVDLKLQLEFEKIK